MTPEEQRIAIAEACGWLKIHNANTMAACGIWVGYDPKNAVIGKPQELPDYLNDLNVMQKAGNKLGVSYWFMLYDVVNRPGSLGCIDMERNDAGWCRTASATSPQRAEAFLRCLNLWKD